MWFFENSFRSSLHSSLDETPFKGTHLDLMWANCIYHWSCLGQSARQGVWLFSNTNTICFEEQLSCCIFTRVLLVSGHGWDRAQGPETRLLLSSLKGDFFKAFLAKGFATKVVRKEISSNFISLFGWFFSRAFICTTKPKETSQPSWQKSKHLQSNLFVNICQLRLWILNVCEW